MNRPRIITIIATERTAPLDASSEYQPQRARIAAARPGSPREVAGAVAWLASRDADYVTGQVLTVDGDLMARI